MDKLWRWIPAIAWGLLLVALSLLPGGDGNFMFLDIPHLDKMAHMGMYAVWTFLVLRAMDAQVEGRLSVLQKWLIIFCITCIGILLELGQHILSYGRSLEIWDMIANAFGSILGAWGQAIYRRKRSG